MKSAILVVPLLFACTTVEYPPVALHGVGQVPDPAAGIMLQCDRLGFVRDSDGHRLCAMRGIDRLRITPVPPSMSHVPLLTYPYPPLAPSSKGLHLVP